MIAFIVHMSADWDWDMAAIGTLVFVFVAVCVSYRTTRAADERRAARRLAEDEAAAEPAVETSAATVEEAPVAVLTSAEHAGMVVATGGAVAKDAAAAPVDLTPAPLPSVLPPRTELKTTSTRRRSRRSGDPRGGPAACAGRSGSRPALRCCCWPVSWLPPYLALRAENSALAASGDGNVTVALDHARRAATLDPLAVSSLLTEASLLQQLGATGRRSRGCSTRRGLQPQNFEVWYALGVLLHGTLRAGQGGPRRPDARPRPQSRATPRAGTSSRCSRGSLARVAGGGGRQSRPRVVDFPAKRGAVLTCNGGTFRMDAAPIGVVGTGYVGLVSAVCFAHLGHDVVCMDVDEAKIARLESGEVPIYEPGLEKLVADNASRLSFTTSYDVLLERCHVLFIAVDTPPSPSGDADLSRVQFAVREIAARGGSGCSS